MLVAAAVCPQTPLLVPQVSGGAAEELAKVRGASTGAIASLCAAQPDLLIAVAPGGESGAREARFGGTLRRFGVDLTVGDDAVGDDTVGDDTAGANTAGDDVHGEPCAGLLVGRWLLDGGFPVAAPPREGWEIGPDTEQRECEEIGRALAGRSARVGLLIMGDGSARRTPKAPGYLDERAVPFDDGIARALADADTAALAAVDPKAASAVMAAGRAPWQVLAGAVGGSGRPWRGRLLCYDAPYGVGYFSAFWEPRA